METKTYYALDKFGNSIPDATVGIYYRGETIPSVVIYDKMVLYYRTHLMLIQLEE